MQLYLEQIGGKAGNYKVTLKKYDDSTAAKGAWDDATCAKNATDHVANADEVAVMGTFNSGCAKIEVPMLNQDPDGPMLMVSHANTNPGLTKTWEHRRAGQVLPDRQAQLRPRGHHRRLPGPGGRAVRGQGPEASRRCYVLNDTETYGLGVAKTFADEAKKQGIEIVGEDVLGRKADANYTALYRADQGLRRRLVFLGGIYDNNGGQLIKDKVAVLGDNNGDVKLIAPDGFTGYPDFLKLPEADGVYLTFAGLSTDPLKAAGGVPAKFLADYKAKYGRTRVARTRCTACRRCRSSWPRSQKSDGTRKGVRTRSSTGAGITIPADKSVIGKEIEIDPATGDVNAKDITDRARQGRQGDLPQGSEPSPERQPPVVRPVWRVPARSALRHATPAALAQHPAGPVRVTSRRHHEPQSPSSEPSWRRNGPRPGRGRSCCTELGAR